MRASKTLTIFSLTVVSLLGVAGCSGNSPGDSKIQLPGGEAVKASAQMSNATYQGDAGQVTVTIANTGNNGDLLGSLTVYNQQKSIVGSAAVTVRQGKTQSLTITVLPSADPSVTLVLKGGLSNQDLASVTVPRS